MTGHFPTRRHFLEQTAGLGAAAWAWLSDAELLGATHHRPRASRVIFLCQSGAPSQIELFDSKPGLARFHGRELPDSIRTGQRLTTMTSEQTSLPVTASMFKFGRHGESGAELSELLPHTAAVADELCIIRSMHTEAINHAPAVALLQTGSQQPGRPGMGAWMSFGLGSENADLPAFVVMVSGGEAGDQPLSTRLWSAGFLPSQHQGVRFRAGRDPVLYLHDPPGISRPTRRRMLNAVEALNRLQLDQFADPEIATRNAQYELAWRMQKSVPELTDLADEPAHTFTLYGDDARQPGTYAANCLLARRMAERGVRFIQLYHRGWDHHLHLPAGIRQKCRETDQASAGLIRDLKQRGLLDDTLVIWAGEFGRTVYCQGELTSGDYGRDHHPRCFSLWLAGGGVRTGQTIGRTDDFSYNIAESPIHIHDLHATVLDCLGIDHLRLTHRFRGRDYRLTDVAGKVVPSIVADSR